MAYSTLFDLDSTNITSEAEVETRLLARLFEDLGYPAKSIIPKKHLKPLKIHDGRKTAMKEVDFLLLDSEGNARIIVHNIWLDNLWTWDSTVLFLGARSIQKAKILCFSIPRIASL